MIANICRVDNQLYDDTESENIGTSVAATGIDRKLDFIQDFIQVDNDDPIYE